MDMNDRAPSLELAAGKASNVDYPQKFVQASTHQACPTNEKAKITNHAEVMGQVLHANKG